MRRNLDLIRKLILRIEEHPHGWAPDEPVDGYDASEIGYHNYLIVDSGLAEGTDITDSSSSGPEWIITHLNSAGHEFAESARNQFIWDEMKEDIKKKGFASAALDIIKQVLDKKIRNNLLSD